ncbi:MAG: methyltransferase domain-containing protein [Opitutales bacterium]
MESIPDAQQGPSGGWEGAWREGRTPWDHGAPAPPLVEYLTNHPAPTGQILVPGSGGGHDVHALASAAAHSAHVLGLDVAPTAVVRARARFGSDNVRFQLGDFLELPPDLHGRFDWLFEHTCLCAIDPARRRGYVHSAHQALKPGAHLLGIFFLDVGERDGEGPPHPISDAELDALFHGHFETLRSWRPKQVFESRQDGVEAMRLLRRS